ncbi:MAG: hypothetical protein KDE51_04190, partial [Anaerolineales bacterium]|nr:hypothetical protein [Anaerolineales bacterium]
VTVEIAKKLDVPNMMLIVNKMPQVYDFEAIKQQVEEAYDAEVAALIPHSDEMMALGSKGVFALQFPDNEVSQILQTVADRLAQ